MDQSIHRAWPAGQWRRLLTAAVTDTDELLGDLGLDQASRVGPSVSDAARQFALRVPRGFVARMKPSDPDDPLLRQVLPQAAETDVVAGFSVDPVGEIDSPPADGVLQKYHGRALLMATSACAIHCRYCFRRHFPYDENTIAGGWEAAVRRISDDRSLSEVILSGGDPLIMPDDRLSSLVGEVAAISHVRRLRIHTRMPIVLPERVDEGLVAWLPEVAVPVVVVVHANHPAEINIDVRRALSVLKGCGVTLFNQAVLLDGLNDDPGILAELSESLFEAGVLPYYLHLLDPVKGAAHFEVRDDRARGIVARLRELLPGYLVPRLVRELPGAPSKVPVELRDL